MFRFLDRFRRSVALAVLGGLAAMPAAVAQPAGDSGDGPWVLGNGANRIRVVPVARDLVHPWSIAFLPNGDLLVAEQNGNLRLIADGVLLDRPIWLSPGAAAGGDALKSVAVHPDFDDNGLVYVAYPKTDGDLNSLAIARGRLDGTQLVDVDEIFVADAWETSGNLGGRILFGPDATLYITVGDRDRLCCIPTDDPSLRLKAQALVLTRGSQGMELLARDAETVTIPAPDARIASPMI